MFWEGQLSNDFFTFKLLIERENKLAYVPTNEILKTLLRNIILKNLKPSTATTNRV